MKKVITLFLLAMACISIQAKTYEYVYNGITFKWTPVGDYGICITGFNNEAEKVIIPGEIHGMAVTKIDLISDRNNYLATELIIEEGVEEIAAYCFNKFKKLKTVTLPTTLKKVRSNAFPKGNDITFNVSSQEIYEMVSEYGHDTEGTYLAQLLASSNKAKTFYYTYNGVTFKCKTEGNGICITGFNNDADKVTIPGEIAGKAVTKVNTYINGNNYLAAEIIIEEGVEEIAANCFNKFRKLKTVTLPSTLKKVGLYAFRKGNDIAFNVSSQEIYAMVRKLGHDAGGIYDAKLLANESKAKKSSKKNSAKDEDKELDKAIAQKKAELEKIKKQEELLALEEQMQQAREKHAKSKAKTSTPVVTPAQPATKVLSDVDIDIPESKSVKSDTYCFIIANEKYEDLPVVDFVENDGNSFKEYCVKALGIPERNVFLYKNASYMAMTRAFQKMESLADATDGKSKFIFYYAGHGSPSEEDQSAYLVPTDGIVTVNHTCFKLGDVYKRFGEMNAQSITVLLDACFSGLNRDNGGLLSARAVARKPKKEIVTGNVIVMSATSEAETAMSYKEKQHGMFTYHLLRKLKESKGNVSLGELFQSVSTGVRRDAIIFNDKTQTPSLAVSLSMSDYWESINL